MNFLEKDIKGSRYKDTVLEESEKDYFDGEGGLTGFISLNGIDNAEQARCLFKRFHYYGAKGDIVQVFL